MKHIKEEIYGFLKLTNISLVQWRGPITDQIRTVGRSSQAEIVIPREYSEVSRKHARVWHDKKGCWICDTGSTFGIKVNGIQLPPEQCCMIEVGDRIKLGSLELHFVATSDLENELKDQPLREPESGAVTGFGEIPDRITEEGPELSTKELSHAELQIVLQIRRGMVTLEKLSKILHRSPNTIRKQLESIYRKLNVHSRHELIGRFLNSKEK